MPSPALSDVGRSGECVEGLSLPCMAREVSLER